MMKQKLTISIGLILTLLTLISATAQLECTLRDNCEAGENAILCLSDSVNAQASVPTPSANGATCPQGNHLCCREVLAQGQEMQITAPITGQCSGNFEYITYLKEATNSLGAVPNEDDFTQSSDSKYTIPVCLSAVYKPVCTIDRDREEGCVVSISDQNDMFSSCADALDNGADFINCQLDSDLDDDSFSADVDCNDDEQTINPNAQEIANGVDDDCDGKIDGDDYDLESLPDGWYQLSELVDERFDNFVAGGINVETTDTGTRVFTTQDGSTHALVSKKIAVEKNKEYLASITTSCNAQLVIAFDDGTPAGTWNFITDQVLDQITSGQNTFSTPPLSHPNAKWASIIIIVDENNCQISQPQLELKGRASPTPYNDIYTPAAFDPYGITTMQASSCCPQGACWNGFACIDNMRESTFKSEAVAGEAIYRCVDSTWVFSKMLYDWNRNLQGSCPDDSQCFVLSSQQASADATAQSFYEGVTPLCINSGESIYDHYCMNGNWTSRTQFLTQKLVEVAGENPYTVSCGSYRDLLLLHEGDQEEQFLAGADGSRTITNNPLTPSDDQSVSVCYDAVADSNLVPNEENTCINNVCVLKYQDGEDEKVVFATSLNKDLADQNSFLNALGIPAQEASTLCPFDENNADEFVECNLPENNGKLWYSAKLNAVIYGPQGVLVDPTFLDRFVEHPLDAIISLFQDEPAISDDVRFIENAQNLREVYLLNDGEHTIRAVLERQGSAQQPRETLVAEFTGFTTPVCEYVNQDHLDLPAELESDPLSRDAGVTPLACTTIDGVQRVEAVAQTRFLWPQLTTRLRTQINLEE